jgi:hypothetical protein
MPEHISTGKSYGKGGPIRRHNPTTTPQTTDIELPPDKQRREVPGPGYTISPDYIKIGNRSKKFGRS